MSGHSKWSQIKRQKGAADVKRGAVFSKLTNAIIVAAKSGGDASTNFNLKMAMEKAHAGNMPKENIQRAIKRGTGELGGAMVEEAVYEIIGPQNIGIICEAATDNKNRTTGEIKNVIAKFGGKLASTGAVAYQFNKMGKVLVDSANPPAGGKEELELAVIDAGAEDFTEIDETLAVYTKPNELEKMKKTLESQGLVIKEAGLGWEPKNMVIISDQAVADKIVRLMEALDNLDDVTAVAGNFDLV